MTWAIKHGDWIERLKELPDESAQCCVTSPPYWGLRDYGVSGQLGLERTPDEYVAKVVVGFREVRRVLRKDGTLWLNLGDTYDPFAGAGTTGLVATRLHRNFIGIELNADYIAMAEKRIENDAPLFNTREVTTETVIVGGGPEESEPQRTNL